MNIAYLGIPGSYSYIAAKWIYKYEAELAACSSIKDVFERVAKNKSRSGVVPIENSTTGSIFETYDCLTNSNLNITGEVYLSLHHQLAWKGLNKLSDLKIIYSHPQAISQCSKFLSKMPNINIVNMTDTATAAKSVANGKKAKSAAITSKLSAGLYGLTIGAENIEDNKKNFTRFSLVGKTKNRNGSKISLLLKVKHVPGSLYRTLEPIAKRGINLTKIESRPILGSVWEYIFIVDLEMDANPASIKNLLTDLKNITDRLSVLGIYNKGEIYET